MPVKLPSKDLFFARAYYFAFMGGWGFILPFVNLFYVSIGLSGTQIGTIASLSAVVGLVVSPVVVTEIKKLPQARMVLQLCLVLGALGYFLLGHQTVFPAILIFIFFHTIVTSAIMPTSDAMAIRVARDHGTGYGSVRLWASVGWIVTDSLAQTLVYTRMRTSLLLESLRAGNELMSAKYARDIDDALEISQKTVRELITDFRCAMDPSGLPLALQTLTEQFCLRNNIDLEYINQVAHLELPLEYEIQAFHIVQEALANIATHSGATHARLIVDFVSGYYVFTVKDNGTGGCTFTPVEGHYGMMIMRERAQRIGGEIRLESTKGFGTHVQLFFPKPGSDW